MSSKPKNTDEVYQTMKEYAFTKGYTISDSVLKEMAENCFLTFESKQWSGIKYWPPIAMRWVLTNKPKFSYSKPVLTKSCTKGKSVRDRILERQNDI